MIDVEQGATINGILEAMNFVLDQSFAEFRSQGGTQIIPGHGRLMDIGDVANYRNMVAIVRDRVRDLKDQGMTLEQVLAAKPTFEYDARWSSDSWTFDMFVAAVYRTMDQN